ncbi:metallopeptidase family protein [Thermaerobacter subterraneus]|uniref:Metallopeptidase family protein n=1 Tax=Thermaerobacter subterraneus DSM 13965 TaxID=867903 RepID=K6Q3A1_9FIRM|nr:metallopeptidase family protein [Thermaerobacter subterraneus]EKP95524.1 hypothetical protein ThesuDRAFT_01276 [Thermaerobacter subterraneus DSM 13965]
MELAGQGPARPPARRPRRLRRHRFVPVDFETFTSWAEEIVDRLPPRLLQELEGGVQIDPKARRIPSDPPGVYLLGEYITEPYLGRFIRIYYGSFERVLAGEPAGVWYAELEETILHELQHHVEGLAGVDWLGLEDLRQLQQLWEEARRGRAPASGAAPGPEAPGEAAGAQAGTGAAAAVEQAGTGPDPAGPAQGTLAGTGAGPEGAPRAEAPGNAEEPPRRGG